MKVDLEAIDETDSFCTDSSLKLKSDFSINSFQGMAGNLEMFNSRVNLRGDNDFNR